MGNKSRERSRADIALAPFSDLLPKALVIFRLRCFQHVNMASFVQNGSCLLINGFCCANDNTDSWHAAS